MPRELKYHKHYQYCRHENTKYIYTCSQALASQYSAEQIKIIQSSAPQRHPQNLSMADIFRYFGHLKYPHDPHDPEKLGNSANLENEHILLYLGKRKISLNFSIIVIYHHQDYHCHHHQDHHHHPQQHLSEFTSTRASAHQSNAHIIPEG